MPPTLGSLPFSAPGRPPAPGLPGRHEPRDARFPLGPHLPPLPPWPAGQEPSFEAWMAYRDVRGARPRALVEWVRHRFAEPRPHWVYVLRHAADPQAVYVGMTSDLADRMRRHAQNAEGRKGMAAPGEMRMLRLGLAHVEDGRAVPEWVTEVPDRVAACLVEVNVTCILAAAGFRVFGHSLDNLCPGAELLPYRAWWERNDAAATRRTDTGYRWPLRVERAVHLTDLVTAG